jgi:hypothetical protein
MNFSLAKSYILLYSETLFWEILGPVEKAGQNEE